MSKSCRSLIAYLGLICLGLSPKAFAATLTVTSLANSGAGTLRDQVAAAAPGDTINFSVTGTISLGTEDSIPIAKNLTITGPGPENLTVTRSIYYDSTIFNISSGVVTISGLTFTNGQGKTVTRVFYDADHQLQFDNEVYGGAIYSDSADLSLTNCVFSNNSATDGGGAVAVRGGSLAVTGCTFSNNSSIFRGGALYIEAALTVTNTSISENTTLNGPAGGIWSTGPATITSSTISNNLVRNFPTVYRFNTGYTEIDIPINNDGAGIYNLGAMVVSNCTISGNICYNQTSTNTRARGGGGIYNLGTLTVANCTITGNRAQFGGGLLNYGAPINLSNSIVADNFSGGTGSDIAGAAASGGYNMVRRLEIAFSGPGDVLLTPDRAIQLAPLGNYGGPTQTHRLLPGCPAMDAGDPSFDTTNTPYDQRGPGFPRIKNGRLCIGAYESETSQSGSNFVVTTLDDHDDGTAGLSDCTLREAIKYAPVGATITFNVAGTITLAGSELVIEKNLTIQGPTSAPGITISGNNQSRIFSLPTTGSGTVAFSHLTLTRGNGVGGSATGNGGAISIDNGYLVAVANCTFFDNSATGSSGAIRNGGLGLTLTNSTFSGNRSTGGANTAGGAIRSGRTLTATNCTFTGNSTSGSLGGGGIYQGTEAVTLSNCIVTGNTATGGPGPDLCNTVGGDYNLVGNASGATLSGANNLIGQLANLGPLANNGRATQTHALLAGSAAINAGSNALIASGVTTDQRGGPRIESGTVDIGAFEVDVTAPTISLSAPSTPIANASSLVTYTVTYSDALFGSSTLSAANVTLNATGTANATVSVDAGTGATRTVTLSTITGTGTLGISIAAGTASDTSGNPAPAAGPAGTFSVDTTPLLVTINQAAGQSDPTLSPPVHFTVIFNKPVANFVTGSVTLSGTAGATTATVTGSGSTYDVAVSGMPRSGTIIATIAAGSAIDGALNDNAASTSTDNAVSYFSPETVQTGGTVRSAAGGGYDVGFIGNPGQTYTIQFTTDLAPSDWQTLRTQVADSSGIISIRDNPPVGTLRRFYRLLLP